MAEILSRKGENIIHMYMLLKGCAHAADPRGYRGYIGPPTGEYIRNLKGFFEKYIFNVFRGFWTSHGRFGPRAPFQKHWGCMALPFGKPYFFRGEPLNGREDFFDVGAVVQEPLQGILGSLSKGYLGPPPTDTAGLARDS